MTIEEFDAASQRIGRIVQREIDCEFGEEIGFVLLLAETEKEGGPRCMTANLDNAGKLTMLREAIAQLRKVIGM